MATGMSAAPGTAPLEPPRRRIDVVDLLGRFAPVLFLIVLVVIFSVQEPNFATERNFWFLLRQNFVFGILAVGMTFVILTGGIDLSIGSVVAFSGLVAAAVAKGSNWRDVGNPDGGGVDVMLAILAAVGVGAGAGLIHGFAIAKLKVPAFVVTLGGLAAWRGAAQVLSDGRRSTSFPMTTAIGARNSSAGCRFRSSFSPPLSSLATSFSATRLMAAGSTPSAATLRRLAFLA